MFHPAPADKDVVGSLIPSKNKDAWNYAPGPEEHLALGDDEDEGAVQSPHAHAPVVLRMVDPALPEHAEAAPANVDSPAVEEDGFVQAAEDGDVSAGALQSTKHLLLMMRVANLVGAQREMQERVQVTEALRGAYERLQAAEAAMAANEDEGE